MGHLVFNANHEAAGSGATSAGGARVTTPKKLLAKPDRGAVAPSLASAGKAPKVGRAAKGKAAKSWNEEVELTFLRDTTSKVDTQLHLGVHLDLTDPKKGARAVRAREGSPDQAAVPARRVVQQGGSISLEDQGYR